jgi:hypothetical protein
VVYNTVFCKAVGQFVVVIGGSINTQGRLWSFASFRLAKPHSRLEAIGLKARRPSDATCGQLVPRVRSHVVAGGRIAPGA